MVKRSKTFLHIILYSKLKCSCLYGEYIACMEELIGFSSAGQYNKIRTIRSEPDHRTL